MKNTTQLLALGLVLFLGSCSTMEENFLDKVANKTAYDDATLTADANNYGTFSSDGKKFTLNDIDNPVFTFVKSTDENNGEYKDPDGIPLTFTTSDGKTGSAPEAGSSTKLWFK